MARLFCLPSAGNGELQFHRWPERIGGWHTCVLRPAEDKLADGQGGHPGFASQAAGLVSAFADVLMGRYALFGHENAALLAYEVAAESSRRGMTPPARLFVSGCPAPQHCQRIAEAMSQASDDELTEQVLAAILATDGNPLPAVVASEVDSLHADLAALRSYRVDVPERLRVPITAIGWSEQDLDPSELAGWTVCGDTEIVRLPGNRLRYATGPAGLLAVIAATGPGN